MRKDFLAFVAAFIDFFSDILNLLTLKSSDIVVFFDIVDILGLKHFRQTFF